MGSGAETVGSTRLSWLCRTDAELQRYFDLDRNLNTARRRVIVVLLVPGLIMAMAFGTAMQIAAGGALVVAGLVEWLRRALPRSPVFGVLSVGSFQLILTCGVATSGGRHSPCLPWLAIPVMMLACRYRRTVTLTGIVAAVAAAILGCGVASWTHTARESSTWLYDLASAALLVAVSIVALTMQTAEIESRSAAARDPLTGLPNRKALVGTLRFRAARAQTTGQWLCVLACDLDHFKQVNDTYGHPRGDDVLVETARRLRLSVPDASSIFRIGGEEFLVVLPDVDRELGRAIAERLRRMVSATPLSQLSITVSVGVAAQRGDAIDVNVLLSDADTALYAAKQAGRNVVRVA